MVQDKTNVIIESRIKDFYKMNRIKGILGEMPIFEFLEDSVRVEVLRQGYRYNGEEVFYVSYEDFNTYIKQGLDKRSNWDEIIGDENSITFTPDIVKYKIENNMIYVTEKVGGGSFPAFYYQEKGADFGSVYLIETCWGDKNHSNVVKNGYLLKDNIEIVSVKKDEQTLFDQGEDKIIELNQLKDLLINKIERTNTTNRDYLDEGISKFFNINSRDVKGEFKKQLEESVNKKDKMNWGNIG